ncbi:MAG: hypothetical protein QG612_471 [Pseudomonadota bacterium]|nr:hypothetical protein [Pseudomonadota bacterium]
MPRLRLLSASILLAFGLTACGGSDSTSSEASVPPATIASAMAGTLVDDLIAGATVFCDTNDNGALDAGEESAITDSAGVYTFAAACTAQIASVAGTGTDLTTLKSLQGQLIGPAGTRVVSPLTTLKVVSKLSDADFAAVLTALGLSGVDVANFNPFAAGADPTLAKTTASLAKVLADIAELGASAGGDPAVAFKAAVGAVVSHARSSTTPAFASDESLKALVNAAVSAGLSAGNTTWDATALAAAIDLATQGLSTLAKQTREAPSLSAARDLLSSTAVQAQIGSVDLKDSAAVAALKTKLADATEMSKAQYVYLKDDSVKIVPVAGSTVDASMTDFKSGLNLTGQTLATLDYVWLPLSATSMALSSAGADLVLGIEIKNTTTGGILQARLTGVTLKPSSDGTVKATVGDDARLHMYLKTGTGIEVGTGKKAITDLSAKILCDCNQGVGIDLQKIASGLRTNFPDNTSLIDSVLTETGTFSVRMVAKGADMRQADGTRLGLSRIDVLTPGSGESAVHVGGVSITGKVTF